MPIDFEKINNEEMTLIDQIARRAHDMAMAHSLDVELIEIEMSLSAAHLVCPLRLEDLAKADDFNLSHDVFGILRHFNPETEQLEDCFWPRYAA